MQSNSILPYIQKIPLFADLNAEQLQLIGQAFEVRSYSVGEDIYVQGDIAKGMLTFLSGQAVMLQTDNYGNAQPVATIIAGQTINQEALFEELIQPVTLRVQRPVQALKLTRQKFVTLLAHHSELKAPLGLSQKDTSHHAHEVRFQGQRENEEVLVYTRRHWWSLVRMAWLPFVIMVVLWVLAIIVQQSLLSTLLFVVSILVPGLILLYMYVEWRNDAVIVTNQRVIRIWRNLITFNSRISEVGIQSVHEVNSEIPPYNPFARLLDFGTIELKTAGDAGNLVLDHIPNPDQFQQIILDDRQNYERRQAQQHHHAVRAELDRWLAGDTPSRIDHSTGEPNNQSTSKSSPKPKEGQSGYLRTRTEMTNGDIVYRKHVYFWLQQTIIPILLMFFSAILLVISIISGNTIGVIGVPMAIFLFMVGVVTYYWADWDWRNDYYVVSDETITLIHQRPLFLENLRDQILMERVDNVVSESNGILETVLKFGDVRVSLIGADEHKLFKNVPQPQLIQQEISRRLQRVKQQASETEARQQREIIGEYLNVFNNRLRQDGVISNSPNDPSQSDSQVLEGQYSNIPKGVASPAGHNVISGRTNQDVPFRAARSADRNRPPGIPRKGSQTGPSKPSMTPGVPYSPGQNTGNRPPRFPVRREDNDR